MRRKLQNHHNYVRTACADMCCHFGQRAPPLSLLFIIYYNFLYHLLQKIVINVGEIVINDKEVAKRAAQNPKIV